MKLRTRVSALLQAGAGLLAASALAGSTVAHAVDVSISNRGTGKCLTVPSFTSPVIQWICDAANVRGQRWWVPPWPDSWQVRNLDTGQCMTAAGVYNGAAVKEGDCSVPTAWQQWKPITLTGNPEVGPWTIRLQLEGTTVCLDLENGDIHNGVPLQVWKCNSKTNN